MPSEWREQGFVTGHKVSVWIYLLFIFSEK